MTTAMLSQPMAGKSDEEIAETREKAMKYLTSHGYERINTLFTDEWYSKEAMLERGVVNIPLCFLAKSLESMSKCDIAYFCKGWENARGCKIEHDVACAYGVNIIYEEPDELTWEELEIGKPYWIEIDYGSWWSGSWQIPEDTDTDDYGQYIVMQSGRKLRRFDDGWRAFKNERQAIQFKEDE